MAFCTSCGTELSGAFCGGCGQKVDATLVYETRRDETAAADASATKQMLSDLYRAQFRPKPFVTIALSTLGWLILPITFGIFWLVIRIPWLGDSGYAWVAELAFCGIPFAFFFHWLNSIGNVEHMSEKGQAFTIFTAALWASLPAILIAVYAVHQDWSLIIASGKGANDDGMYFPAVVPWALSGLFWSLGGGEALGFKRSEAATDA